MKPSANYSFPSERVKFVRSTITVNRTDFCRKHSLSVNTLRAWENGVKPLTPKAANALIDIFKKEGIICGAEWLLRGEGPSPKNISDIVLTIETTPIRKYVNTENLPFKNEVNLFLSSNQNSEVFQITNDSMQPLVYNADVIGGILVDQDKYSTLLGTPCIYIDKNEDFHVKLITAGIDSNRYNLRAMNLSSSSGIESYDNLIPETIYKIVWIRRP